VTVSRTPHSSSTRRGATLLLLASLAGCTTYTGIGDEKIDYRSTGNKTAGLDVPPDLTQLARDSRYQPQGGTVSATSFQSAASAPVATSTAATSIAPQQLGELRMERAGNIRWLATTIPPDQLWPQIEGFWKERGMTLVADQPTVGVMETDWAENRAKLPNDIIRNTIGKVFDSLYSTGERDKFITRVERGANGGSEVYVSHRGMVEVYLGTQAQASTTVWQPRPADPLLEAEILQRLMVRLGAKEEQAKTAVATTTAQVQPVRARAVEGQAAAALAVDDPFDRAWRRVGLALDRSGFTVEDRDRTQGLYYVRYVDPALAGKEEPGFFSRLFTFGAKKDTGPARYRVVVKGEGDVSTVTVLNAQGAPENGEAGKRIVRLLVEDLK
jgi:outer membrane protein assembly factor BamC